MADANEKRNTTLPDPRMSMYKYSHKIWAARSSRNNYYPHMRRGKVIGLSVKIARSQHLGTRAARKHNSQLESATNWLEYA